ncbi:histidine kinase [Runella sp. SP2]|uniref:histidine kinase n=1 Tax=Runella sp. SP2 TaxID=2268026 RepID=UPI000F07F88C|nr:histidine kinase [Runella sp. SP2]AYQ31634.1 response regulator [Runella sp. SP2]
MAYSILYVDDEPDNILAFKAVFRRQYTIFSTQSAEQALEVLRSEPIDLIISDQRMPHTTGVAFFEQIIDEFPDPIRMILTGYSDVQAIIDAINKGKIYHYITKPWKMEELKLVMDKAFEVYSLKRQNQQLEEERNSLLIKTIQQEKNQLLAQFETLKNQLSPHFLFNSMNALASLIASNPQRAIDFTGHFSKVYRSMLEIGGENLIPLREELDFVRSFVFLQQMRFDENLQVQIELSEAHLNDCLPPFTLQLLVENAIKHNIISDDKPLTITIRMEGEWLTVRNTLQRRGSTEPSTGIGLKNLAARYAYLVPHIPTFSEVEGQFVARVPLILEG